MKTSILLVVTLLTSLEVLCAQFDPGAIYRDYVFTISEASEKDLSLATNDGHQLRFLDSIDLVRAAKAEVILEQALKPGGRLPLSIRFNGNTPHLFGNQSSSFSGNKEHATSAMQRLEVPIGELYQGRKNFFSLASDSLQRPSQLAKQLSAVILRITYFSDKSTLAPPVIFHPTPQAIPAKSLISIVANSNYVSVDYALEATDADWSGSGDFYAIHWQTAGGEAINTIGSSSLAPDFFIQWDTEWLPDQRHKMKLHVRAKDREGIYHVGQPLAYLELAPRAYGVALVVPYDVPELWNTRDRTNTQKMEISIEPELVKAYRLLWTSSSPCYANGLYLNGHLVWMRSENCGNGVVHDLAFSDQYRIRFLKPGLNILATGKTPPINEGEANGMDIMWPGILMKIRY